MRDSGFCSADYIPFAHKSNSFNVRALETDTDTHTYTHRHTCIYKHTYIYKNTHRHTYKYIHTYTMTHTHTHRVHLFQCSQYYLTLYNNLWE